MSARSRTSGASAASWRVEIDASEARRTTYTYEYVGRDAQQALGKDLTGVMFMSHLQHFPAARVTQKIADAVGGGLPISDEGTFVNDSNKIVKYRSCLLPFGRIDGVVTRVVLGLSWKIF